MTDWSQGWCFASKVCWSLCLGWGRRWHRSAWFETWSHPPPFACSVHWPEASASQPWSQCRRRVPCKRHPSHLSLALTHPRAAFLFISLSRHLSRVRKLPLSILMSFFSVWCTLFLFLYVRENLLIFSFSGLVTVQGIYIVTLKGQWINGKLPCVWAKK